MATTFLFRVDGAKDNDAFFAAICRDASCAYAGVDFRVGRAGWIPDLVKVMIVDRPDKCSLTLIELEATESVALVSCRKYLPESSAGIVAVFMAYLDRVILKCRSTADPREAALIELRDSLLGVENITVTTAGALRASATFVEELPLIDQLGRTAIAQDFRMPASTIVEPQNGHAAERIFEGVVRLNQQESHAMGRSIMIFDAVIRGRDHSAAKFKEWRDYYRSKPMKHLLAKEGDSFPSLGAFIFDEGNRGTTLDFEAILRELVKLWSDATQRTIDLEVIRRSISRYFPLAITIKAHEKMYDIFEVARAHVSSTLP
jgi:hypothetical protein